MHLKSKNRIFVVQIIFFSTIFPVVSSKNSGDHESDDENSFLLLTNLIPIYTRSKIYQYYLIIYLEKAMNHCTLVQKTPDYLLLTYEFLIDFDAILRQMDVFGQVCQYFDKNVYIGRRPYLNPQNSLKKSEQNCKIKF